ncbi:MAG: hypothetical protein ACKVWV_12800 [Planctomycetota bacterium]
MSLSLVSGTITQLRERAEVRGDDKSITTHRATEFRIDNRPANFAAAFNASVGDKVTAVGKNSAELEVIALRNDTTNVIYFVGMAPLGGIAILLACPVIAIAVMLYDTSWAFLGFILLLGGFVSFPGGIYLLFKRRGVARAVRMVEQAPRA